MSVTSAVNSHALLGVEKRSIIYVKEDRVVVCVYLCECSQTGRPSFGDRHSGTSSCHRSQRTAAAVTAHDTVHQLSTAPRLTPPRPVAGLAPAHADGDRRNPQRRPRRQPCIVSEHADQPALASGLWGPASRHLPVRLRHQSRQSKSDAGQRVGQCGRRRRPVGRGAGGGQQVRRDSDCFDGGESSCSAATQGEDGCYVWEWSYRCGTHRVGVTAKQSCGVRPGNTRRTYSSIEHSSELWRDGGVGRWRFGRGAAGCWVGGFWSWDGHSASTSGHHDNQTASRIHSFTYSQR